MSVRAPVIDTIFFMGRCLSKRDNIRLRASRIRSTFVHMRPKLLGLKQLHNTVFEGSPQYRRRLEGLSQTRAP